MQKQAVKLTPINSLYESFDSPFRYQGKKNPSYSIIYPRHRLEVGAPCLEVGSVRCPTILNYEQSEVAIIFLPDALVSHTGAVVFKDEFLIEETLEGSPAQNGFIEDGHMLFFDRELVETKDTVALITNKYGTFNYSIFLAEMLPSAYLAAMHFDLAALDCPIYFPSFMNMESKLKRLTLLETMGIRRDKIVSLNEGWRRYKGIVIFKINDRYKNFRISQLMPCVSATLKAKFATSTNSKAKVIYVSRQNAPSRKLRNFDVLKQQVLDPYGFIEVDIDTCSIEDQVNWFSKADLVMAEHGAALVNAMFMRPSASLIEIFPHPMVGRFMYRLIANNFKLNYFFGSMAVGEGWRWNLDNLDADIEVYQKLSAHAISLSR